VTRGSSTVARSSLLLSVEPSSTTTTSATHGETRARDRGVQGWCLLVVAGDDDAEAGPATQDVSGGSRRGNRARDRAGHRDGTLSNRLLRQPLPHHGPHRHRPRARGRDDGARCG
jgi:hypothetical protein